MEGAGLTFQLCSTDTPQKSGNLQPYAHCVTGTLMENALSGLPSRPVCTLTSTGQFIQNAAFVGGGGEISLPKKIFFFLIHSNRIG